MPFSTSVLMCGRGLPARRESFGSRTSVTYFSISNRSLAVAWPRRVGISRHPTSTMKSSPASATPSPTGVKSNMRNGGAPVCARNEAAMMFGGVPISVVMPPSSEANASGMRKTEAGIAFRRATWMATGMTSASAPMLFMNAESAATMPVSAASCTVTPPWSRSSRSPSRSTTPEFCRPRLMTSTAATVITAALLNPLKTRSAEIRPVSATIISASRATTS